jgi:uroporphyrinogen-III synthase
MSDQIASQVVITRPLAQADALMRRVLALGRDAVIFPLLEIQALPDPTPLQAALRDLGKYALIAFVSPNAIDAAFAVRPDWPHDIPLAVVGEGSRLRLAMHGVTAGNATIFSPPDNARTDSQTLLAELDLAALQGRQVLIIRGETGREFLRDALCAANVQVATVAAYRRMAPALNEERRGELKRLLHCQNDWLVTSSEALRILMNMVAQLDEAGSVAKMQQQRIVVPHVRIAETARLLGFDNIMLTRSGDDGLIAALQSCP